MADVYTTMATSLIASGYNTPPIVEQINTWVLTGLGYNAAGSANTSKYVTAFDGTVDIPTLGAAYVAAGITDPVGCEKVSQIALTYTPPS